MMRRTRASIKRIDCQQVRTLIRRVKRIVSILAKKSGEVLLLVITAVVATVVVV
jgi:hypothetical protein